MCSVHCFVEWIHHTDRKRERHGPLEFRYHTAYAKYITYIYISYLYTMIVTRKEVLGAIEGTRGKELEAKSSNCHL